ncbi:hypothetical protein F5B21DRAFT_319318 [Xylaria acuta]|nr:hypothetical protein F5B21DRAFT_319318 [Xylaria acuta]
MDNFHYTFCPFALYSLIQVLDFFKEKGNGRITSFVIGIVYCSTHSGICLLVFFFLRYYLTYRFVIEKSYIPLPSPYNKNKQTATHSLHSPQLAANRPNHNFEKLSSHAPSSQHELAKSFLAFRRVRFSLRVSRRDEKNPSICRGKAEGEEKKGRGRFSTKTKSHATTKHSHV